MDGLREVGNLSATTFRTHDKRFMAGHATVLAGASGIHRQSRRQLFKIKAVHDFVNLGAVGRRWYAQDAVDFEILRRPSHGQTGFETRFTAFDNSLNSFDRQVDTFDFVIKVARAVSASGVHHFGADQANTIAPGRLFRVNQHQV